MTLTVGSLFSGIGGIDLGLERAGMRVLWQSEIEPYACRVLQKHWPDVPNLGDVRTIDWKDVPYVDVIAGGYPCQPFSNAGRRAGEDDPRHLWPEFANAIRGVRPRFALLENVSAHLSLGFGSVLGDLAALGYDARWDCLPAASVGAPHLRDRLFVIATRTDRPHSDQESEPGLSIDGKEERLHSGAERGRTVADADNIRALRAFRSGWDAPWHGRPFVADADGLGRSEGSDRGSGEVSESGQIERSLGRCSTSGEPSVADAGRQSAQIPTPREQSGFEKSERYPSWPTEPSVGRMVDGVPYRLDRLRGLGNAVVPQVAEHLGWIIRSIA